MYHVANAWETDTHIHLVGCEIAEPLAHDPSAPEGLPEVPQIAMLRLEPYLTEWVFDREHGTITKTRLDDTIAEFPRIDVRRTGKPFRYTYLMRFADKATLAFDGVIRHDYLTGETVTHPWPAGWYGNEAVFCPKAGSDQEDQGYLVTFVVNDETGESEVHVVDVADMENEPVCRLSVPVRVPYGYHTWWVSADDLAQQRRD